MEIKTWSQIKDEVYGKVGTEKRDALDRDVKAFITGLELRQARERKKLTQAQLGSIINKKREYISKIENNGSNITLKTLYEFVEKGLGGKVTISIEV